MTSSSSPPLDPANDLLPLDVGKLYPYKKLEKLVRVPTLMEQAAATCCWTPVLDSLRSQN